MKKIQYWGILESAFRAQAEGRLHEVIADVKRGIKYAKKIDDNQLYYQLAYILHYYTYIIKQDSKAGRKVRKELETARLLRDAEEKARVGYTELTFKLNRSRRTSDIVKEEINQYCNEVGHLIELNNVTISLYIFPMLITQAYLANDYQLVIEYCERAISFFDEKGLNKSQHFYSLMMVALIILGQYKKASLIIKKAKKRIIGKRYSWSVFVYFETINLIHAKHYNSAYHRLIEADRKEQINPAMKEQWQIVKGFFQIFSNAGYLNNSIHFRISKIINDVPIFNKDKYGNFINILILKIILGIQENRGRLIEEREAIEKAYQRYCLKGSRERVFIRILLRIPVHRFNLKRVEKACKQDFKTLAAMPMRPDSIDIVPWDVLLDIVLDELN